MEYPHRKRPGPARRIKDLHAVDSIDQTRSLLFIEKQMSLGFVSDEFTKPRMQITPSDLNGILA